MINKPKAILESSMKTIFSFLIVLAITPSLAQEISLTTGYVKNAEPSPFQFDKVRGVHLGVNYYKADAGLIGWDSQLSINSSFSYENSVTFSALIGGRIYFNGPDNSDRYFFNALGGAAFYSAVGDDYTENLFTAAYSGGFHAAFKKIQLGVSFERPEVLVFKVGYIF